MREQVAAVMGDVRASTGCGWGRRNGCRSCLQELAEWMVNGRTFTLGAIGGAGVSVQLALAGRAVARTGSATEEASQSGIRDPDTVERTRTLAPDPPLCAPHESGALPLPGLLTSACWWSERDRAARDDEPADVDLGDGHRQDRRLGRWTIGIGPGGWGEGGLGGEGCDDGVVVVVIAGLGVPDLKDLEPVGRCCWQTAASSTRPASSPTPTGTPSLRRRRGPHRCAPANDGSHHLPTSPNATTGLARAAAARRSTRSPRCSSTGTATGSGGMVRCCWTPSTPGSDRLGRCPVRHVQRPPTSPAGGGACPLRFRCAWAATTSHRRLPPARPDRLPRRSATAAGTAAAAVDGADEWTRAEPPLPRRRSPAYGTSSAGSTANRPAHRSRTRQIREAAAVRDTAAASSLCPPSARHCPPTREEITT